MGSWNKTCGLSNLHIHAGQPVYVFILEENVNKGDFCYSSCLYLPCLVPFTSVYDDYGGGEKSSGIGLPYLLDGLRKNLVELEVGANSYHDVAVKRDEFDINMFFESCHEDRLQVSSRRGNRPVKFTMMRKDVVDEVLNRFSLYNYQDSKSYTYYDCLKQIEAVAEKIEKAFNDRNNGYGPTWVVSAKFPELHKIKYILDWSGSLFTEQLLSGLFSGNRTASSLNVDDIVFSIATAESLSQEERLCNLKEFLSDCLKGIVLDTFMDKTRKLWTPGGHEGSQNTDLDGHKILLSVVQDVVRTEEENIEKEEWPPYNHKPLLNLATPCNHFEVRMSDELAQEFHEIQEITGLNAAEVFRRAISLYKLAKEAIKNGEQVILRSEERERWLTSI